MIRSILGLLAFLLVTPPLALVTFVAPWIGLGERYYDWLARTWCGVGLFATGIRVRSEGIASIPRDQPVIIVSNHHSWFDIGALAVTVPQRYRFVAKQELGRIPLWGRSWQASGHISINRENRQAALRSLQAAGRIIRSDNSAIIIFPEGTRSPHRGMLPFKKGGFKLALSLGVSVLPVAIVGSREIMPRNSWRVNAGEIIVRFGRPIPTSEYTEQRLDELMARARTDIEALLEGRTTAANGDHGDHFERTRA